ncbi:MAG: methyl-accepting chemotaxis protein, partial [Vallitaleaceae bacterium]|nr:methyl-accepting chemotaxis protein [Vallitaleaceae bacterium]
MNTLRKLKVAPRIVIGFVFLLILLVIIGITGLTNLKKIIGESKVLENTSEISFLTLVARLDQTHYQMSADQTSQIAVKNHLQQAMNQTAVAKSTMSAGADLDRMNELSEYLNQFQVEFDKFVTLEKQKKDEEQIWRDSTIAAKEAVERLFEIQEKIIKDATDKEMTLKAFSGYQITVQATQNFIEARALVNAYVQSGNEDTLKAANTLLSESLALYEEQKALYFITHSDIVIQKLTEYQQALNQYVALRNEQAQMLKTIDAYSLDVSNLANEAKLSVQTDIKKLQDSTILISLILIVVAILIGLISTWLISRSIKRPLKQYADTLHAFGAGDLNVQFDVTGNDELTDMGKVLNIMKDKLRGTIENIVESANGFQVATEEVKESTNHFNGLIIEELKNTLNLSATNEEAMNNVSIAIEEVSKGALSAAEYATTSANAAEKTRTVSELAAHAMDEVVGEIKHVGKQAKSIHSKMDDVQKSVEKISGFANRIAEIA